MANRRAGALLRSAKASSQQSTHKDACVTLPPLVPLHQKTLVSGNTTNYMLELKAGEEEGERKGGRPDTRRVVGLSSLLPFPPRPSFSPF